MISKKEITNQQVETYCRQRNIKLCKSWLTECQCIYIEPVVMKNSRGLSVVDCAACSPLCKKCNKPYSETDSNVNGNTCWDCQASLYSGFIGIRQPGIPVPVPVAETKYIYPKSKGKSKKKSKAKGPIIDSPEEDNYIELGGE